jgi:hypothetical protein
VLAGKETVKFLAFLTMSQSRTANHESPITNPFFAIGNARNPFDN